MVGRGCTILLPCIGAHLSLGCVVNRVVNRLGYKRTCIGPKRARRPGQVGANLLNTRVAHSGDNFFHLRGVFPKTS